MVRKVLRGTLAVLVICTATISTAAAAGSANYATLQVGAVVPSNGDTTWSINAIVGHYFTPNFAVEGSLGYYSTDYVYAGLFPGELTVWPVSVSVKAGAPVQRLFPYALAGGDIYFTDGEIPSLGLTDSDTAFGYHLGAGVELAVSPKVYVGLEYRYTFIETKLFGVDRELDGGSTTGTFGFRF